MAMNHMIKYHLVIPAGVFAVALLVGAPLGTAFVVAMMTGCMSMMLMMTGGGHGDHRRDREPDDDRHTIGRS